MKIKEFPIFLALALILFCAQSPVYAGFDSPYQGTVQIVGTGNLSPIATCVVTGNPRINPTLQWTLNGVPANQAFGNFTGAAAAPTYGVVSIGAGGTGKSSPTLAFDALSPLTTVGDLITYFGGSNIRLPGNITPNGMYLRSIGTGVTANLPTWASIQSSDIPWSTPGTIGNITPQGGFFTSLSSLTPMGLSSGGTNNNLSSVAGGSLYTDGSKIANLGAGSQFQVVQSNGALNPTYANVWNGVGGIIVNGTTTLTATCATLQEISNVAGSVTVNIPVANTCSGQLIQFIHTAGSSALNTITIQTQGGNTMSGQASLTLDPVNLNSGLLLESDGNNWKVLSYSPNTTPGTLYYIDANNLPAGTAPGINGQVLSLVGGVPTWGAGGGGGGGAPTDNFIQQEAQAVSPLNLSGTNFTTQLVTTGGSLFTVNLPAASLLTHKIYLIKKVDGGAGSISIVPNGGDLIDGGAGFTVAAQYDFIAIQSDGTNWNTIGKFQAAGGTGSVTNVSSGSLAGVFTTNVANSTTTPSITYSFGTSGAHTFLGNPSGSSGTISMVQPNFTDLAGTATDAQIPVTLSGHTLAGTTSLAGTFLPSTSGATDLGSSSMAFRNLYLTDNGNVTSTAQLNVRPLSSNVTVNIPAANSTTVQGATAPASHFATSIDPVTGVITWTQPTFADLSGAGGALPITAGGTGQITAPLAFSALAPATSSGGLIYGTGVNTYGNKAIGNPYQLLGVDSGGLLNYVYSVSGLASQTTSTVLNASSASYQTMAPGASNVTFTLPNPNTCLGKVFVFEQISGSGTTTIQASSGSIEGLSSTELALVQPFSIVSDGVSTWRYLFPFSPQAQINRVIAAANAANGTGGYYCNYFGDGSDGALSVSPSLSVQFLTGGANSSGFQVYNFTTIDIQGIVSPTNNTKATIIYCQGDCNIASGAELTATYIGQVGAGTLITIRKLVANTASADVIPFENTNQVIGFPTLTTYTSAAVGGTGGTAGTAGAIGVSGGNGGNGNTVANATGGGGGGGGGGGSAAAGLIAGAGGPGTAYCGGSGGGGGRGAGGGGNSGGSAATAGTTAGGGNGGNGQNSSTGAGGGGGGRGAGLFGTSGTGGTGAGAFSDGAAGQSTNTLHGPGTLILIVGGTLTNNGKIDSDGHKGLVPNPFPGTSINGAADGGNGGSGVSTFRAGGGGGGGGGWGGGRVIVLYGKAIAGSGTITANGGAGGTGGAAGVLSVGTVGAGGNGGTGGAGSVTTSKILPNVY